MALASGTFGAGGDYLRPVDTFDLDDMFGAKQPSAPRDGQQI